MKLNYKKRSAAYVPRGTVSVRPDQVPPHSSSVGQQHPYEGFQKPANSLGRLKQKLNQFISPRRPAYFITAIVMLVSIIAATGLGDYVMTRPASLSAAELQLTGESRDDIKEYLKFDEKTKSFSFEVSQNKDSGEASQHVGRVADAYSASFPSDAKDGVTVTDTNTKIAVTVRPNFFTAKARKQEQGQIVYNSTRGKLTYTLKYNGLKEDIILDKPQGDQLTFNFDLVLPNGVEARLDEQGNIGIYSADPSLFGQISFGSDSDRERVEKARQNGEKSNLVMTIPYPIVKDATGQEYTDKANFSLGRLETESSSTTVDKSLPPEVQAEMQSKTVQNVYPLTIESYGLKDLAYPISIDPTIRTTSSSDFAGGNFMSTELDPDDTTRIQRQSLSGGVLTDETDSFMPEARWGHGSAVWNDWFYIAGGIETSGGAGTNEVRKAQINTTTGALGSFTSEDNLNGGGFTELVAYNGYLYAYLEFNDRIEYAKINSDGTINAWVNGPSSTAHGLNPGFIAYDNRIYLVGGDPLVNGTATTTVTYYPVNGDGSLGTIVNSSGNYLPTGVLSFDVVQHDNYFLIAGGYPNLSTTYTGRVASDGSIAWRTNSSTLVTGRFTHNTYFHRGYIYVMGGYRNDDGATTDGNAFPDMATTMEYAPLNADGSIGTFRNLNTNLGVAYGSIAKAGNYLFFVGGCTTNVSANNNCSGGSPISNAVSPYLIKPAGELASSSWSSGTSLAGDGSNTTRNGVATTVYNGYIYAAGGQYTNLGVSAVMTSVERAAISADGSIGAWTSSGNGNMVSARMVFGLVAHNGYIYAIGGCNSSLSGACSATTNVWESASLNSSTGAVGTWSNYGGGATNNMVQSRGFMTATVHNGYIYTSVGSNSGGTSFTKIEYAQIDTANPGRLGTWAESTNTVTSGSGQFSRVEVWGDKIIYFPGVGTVLQYNTIEANGTVTGTWQSGTALPAARYGMGTSVSNGFLYMIGGFNGSAQTTVYAMPLSSSGVPSGTWRSVTSLSTASACGDSVAHVGFIYMIGVGNSCNATNNSGATAYIPINNGGSGNLGTWAVDGGGNFSARKLHATVAYNGFLYVLGGCPIASCTTAGNATANVAYAAIDFTGEVGTWNSAASFSNSRERLIAFAYNDRMYIMGGRRNSSSAVYMDDVQQGSINTTTGDIASWTAGDGNMASGLPGGSGHHQMTSTLVGNKVYVTGGTNNATSYDNVYFSTIDTSTGAMSEWQSTTARPNEVRGVWLSANNGYLYAMGGINSGSTMTNASYYAAINSDGTIGSWTATTAIPYEAYTNSAGKTFVHNGYIYLIYDVDKNDNPTSYVPYSFRAPVTSSGRIGRWGSVTMPNYTGNAYLNFSSEFYSGRMYVTGGHISGGTCDPCARTVYSTVQSIPRNGSYSRLIDFGAPVKPTKLITRGTERIGTTTAFAFSASDESNTTLTSGTGVANIGYGASNPRTITLPGSNVTTSRYFWLRYTLDESQSAVFPDYGDESTITDFDLYFTPNPGQRLRGGRSFSGQQDRGLDAAPQ